MGIVKDFISGQTGAKAAKRAASVQQAAADRGIAATEAGREQARADLEPFAAAGRGATTDLQVGLKELNRLITNPEAQKEFITNNPFFDALTKRSSDTLLNRASAGGKLGSGGTAEALQESVLLIGSDLLNQNITQRQNVNSAFQNLVTTGSNAATNQARVSTGAAANISELGLQNANAQAAGIVGAQRARQTAADNAENRLIDAAKFAAGGGINL